MFIRKHLLLQLVTLAACGASRGVLAEPSPSHSPGPAQSVSQVIFAGGCFWCMEPPFEKLNGVQEVVSGYAGGSVDNPTYEQVSSDKTGHREVVLVKYDPEKISFEKLMEVFWRNVDPTDAGGQFVDRGLQYTTAVMVYSGEQRTIAEKSKRDLEMSKKFSKPVVTPIIDAMKFFPAEEYHQDYYKKNPVRYKYYRYGSGRDKFIEKVWGETAKGSN